MSSVLERTTLRSQITQFDGAHERQCERHAVSVAGGDTLRTDFAGARWEITAVLAAVPDRVDALDGRITFRVAAGAARDVAVAIEFHERAWSREVFVMLPAAALRWPTLEIPAGVTVRWTLPPETAMTLRVMEGMGL